MVAERVVAATPLAVVRRSVAPGGIADAWRPALDVVWAFLRGRDGLWRGGHNVFVYHHAPGPHEPMVVEFGVQVMGPFDAEGEVVPSATPAGRVAWTTHHGPVAAIGAAHAAIERWRLERHASFAGISWETYGDPGPDPAAFEIEVAYLLKG